MKYLKRKELKKLNLHLLGVTWTQHDLASVASVEAHDLEMSPPKAVVEEASRLRGFAKRRG